MCEQLRLLRLAVEPHGAVPLLADDNYAPLNPPEWIERWGPQVVLLSVAAGDAQGWPDPQALSHRQIL